MATFSSSGVTVTALVCILLAVMVTTTEAKLIPPKTGASGVRGGGQLLWEHMLSPTEFVLNPILSDSVAYVPTNTSVYAFDLASGSRLWKFSVPQGDTGAYLSTDEVHVFVGTLLSVTALDRATGAVHWTFSLPQPPNENTPPLIHARADVFNGLVYVTTSVSPLLALDAWSGKIAFTLPVGGVAFDHVRYNDGIIYFMSTFGDTSYAVAADANNGTVLWTISDVNSFIISVEAGMMYTFFQFGQSQGLYANNLGPVGNYVWNITYNGINSTDYYAAGGVLYTAVAATINPYPTNLIAYNGTTGEKRWEIKSTTEFYFLPNDQFLINFGAVTSAFAASNGQQLWTYNASAINDGGINEWAVVFGTPQGVAALALV